MDGTRSWDPPIATLPRQRRRALPGGAGSHGFARLALRRNRRLGWLLWGGLVGLLLALSTA
jgi:hypothetical protein